METDLSRRRPTAETSVASASGRSRSSATAAAWSAPAAPTMTIMALAFRAAEHIAEAARRGDV